MRLGWNEVSVVAFRLRIWEMIPASDSNLSIKIGSGNSMGRKGVVFKCMNAEYV